MINFKSSLSFHVLAYRYRCIDIIQIYRLLCTYFNAINGNVNGVETNCSWSPVSTVSSIIVDSYQHVFTWSREGKKDTEMTTHHPLLEYQFRLPALCLENLVLYLHFSLHASLFDVKQPWLQSNNITSMKLFLRRKKERTQTENQSNHAFQSKHFIFKHQPTVYLCQTAAFHHPPTFKTKGRSKNGFVIWHAGCHY